MNPEHELESYQHQIQKKHSLQQMVNNFREEGFQLKKKIVQFQQVQQVLTSPMYAELMKETIFKARELEMMEEERKSLGGCSEQRLIEMRLKNEIMREKVDELEYLNEMEKERTNRLMRQFDIVDEDLEKLAVKKNTVLNQIQSIQCRQTPPMEAQLQNKIIKRINAQCKEQSQMVNQDQTNLISSGRYHEFIVNQGLQLKKICMNIKRLELELPEKYSQYTKLKKEQEELQTQFDKYFENSEIHTQADLVRQEELLKEQKEQLEKQIEEQKTKQLYLVSNCEKIARQEAAFKARQLALNKQQEIDRKKTIIKSLLPIVASNDINVQRDQQYIQQKLALLEQEDNHVREKLQMDHSHPIQP